MNGGDDLARSPGRPSVRVEMDALGDSQVSAADPTVDPRSIWRVTAVLIGVIVVGTLVLARGSGEEDESQDVGRAAPQRVDRSGASLLDEDPGVDDERLVELVPTNLQGSIRAVIGGDSGWLAFHETSSRRLPPRIKASSDGVTWRELDAVFEIDELDGAWRSFTQPTADDFGFAMLMTEVWENSDGGRTVQIDRLTSSDGQIWAPDSGFSSVVGSLDTLAEVRHIGDWVQTSTILNVANSGTHLIRQLLESELVDQPPIDWVCWTFDLDGRLHLVGCDDDTVAELRPGELRDPDRYHDLAACLAELEGPMHRAQTVSVVGGAVGARTVNDISSLVGARTTRDGTLVVLDGGAPAPVGELACAGMLNLPVPVAAEPSLVIWPADLEASVRLELQATDVPLTGGLRDVAVRSDGSLRLLVGSAVWEVRRGLERVRSITTVSTNDAVDRVTDAFRPDSITFDETGDRLVVISGGQVSVIDIDSGRQTDLGRFGEGREWSFLLGFFDDLVLVNSGWDVRLLPLEPLYTDAG